MENLAPQSNENNKSLTMVDGQDNFDFEKNIVDNGKQFINFVLVLRCIRFNYSLKENIYFENINILKYLL